MAYARVRVGPVGVVLKEVYALRSPETGASLNLVALVCARATSAICSART